MLHSVRPFDAKVAAGILANAALKLTRPGYYGPALVAEQDQVEREAVLEVRRMLGLAEDDSSPEAIEKLGDALDAHADALIGGRTEAEAISALSSAGLLPSDLYHLEFDVQLEANYGEKRWGVERALAAETVHAPDREQVFGPHIDPNLPALINLYARFFKHEFPAKSFWFIVAGQRNGGTLYVTQIWRVYPATFDISGCPTLLDVVSAIARRFGHPVEIDGRRDSFFVVAPSRDVHRIMRNVNLLVKRNRVVVISFFNQTHESRHFASVVVSIDFTSYLKYIEDKDGWNRNLFTDIHATLTKRAKLH